MAVLGTGINHIDSLLLGFSWTGVTGAGATIQYGFGKESTATGRILQAETNIFAIDKSFENAVSAATGIWSQYANVRFDKVNASVTNPSDPPLLFGLTYSGIEPNVLGFLDPQEITANGFRIISGDIVIAPDLGGAELRQGKSGFQVLLHEIGHALGLAHPFESSTFPTNEDNFDYSIMSYTDGTYAKLGSSALATPAPYDIAALQYLYGANMSTNAGNNRHTIKNGENLRTIWDAGGNDTIDTTSYNSSVVIDLGEGGGKPIRVGSTTVWLALGSNVENAVAGAGNDTISGNALNNVLSGGAGNDSILGGGGGADSILGGDGNDTIGAATGSFIDGGNGIDAISYENSTIGVQIILTAAGINGIDSLGNTLRNIEGAVSGSTFNDTIIGDSANNTFAGSSGNDNIQGAAGNDSVNGNTGSDTLVGGQGNDVLRGGQDNDQLNGGQGDDTIIGGLGDDTIQSGQGGDSVNGGGGKDFLDGNQGSDTISGGDGNDLLFGNNGNDLLLGGGDNDILYGGAGINTLEGGNGEDSLIGGGVGSSSLLLGNNGDDKIVASGGNDTLTGGVGSDDFAFIPGIFGDVIVTDFIKGIDTLTFADVYYGNKVEDVIAAAVFDATANTNTFNLLGGGSIVFLNTPFTFFIEEIVVIKYKIGDSPFL